MTSRIKQDDGVLSMARKSSQKNPVRQSKDLEEEVKQLKPPFDPLQNPFLVNLRLLWQYLLLIAIK